MIKSKFNKNKFQYMNHVNQSYFIAGRQRLIKLQLHNYSNCF